MIIRPLEQSDFAALDELHDQMGLDYLFPDLNSPLFVVKQIATDDSGRIIAAAVVKIETEVYLWVSPSQRFSRTEIATRWEAIEALTSSVVRKTWEQGIDYMNARVPVCIEKKFSKPLRRLGFTRDRDEFHTWSRAL